MRLATRAAAAAGITAGLVAAVLGATSPAWAANPPPVVTCGPPGLGLGGPTVILNKPMSDSTIGIEQPTLDVTATPTVGTITSVQVAVCLTGSTNPVHVFTLTPAPGSSTEFTMVPSVPSVPLLVNGPYTFTVSATQSTLGVMTSTSTNVAEILDAPSQPPQNVATAPASDGHSVLVSWTPPGPPTETDISGYRVKRDGQFVSGILGPKTTNYRDTTTSPGKTYAYAVVALRPDFFSGKDPLVSQSSQAIPAITPSSPSAGNKSGVQGSHGGASSGGGGGVTGSLGGGGGGSLRIAGGGGVTGSFSKPSLGTSKPITGAPTLGGFQNTLPYGQSGVALGGQPNASRSTSPAKEDGPHGYPVWTIALAVLLLAAAGFLFTLRRRIANEKPALEAVQTPRRPAMRASGTDFTNPRR